MNIREMERTLIVKRIMLLLMAFLLVLTAAAQEEPAPEATDEAPAAGQVVEVAAGDGLRLAGEFYRVDPARPTVLLLHQLYTTRRSWEPLIPLLLERGYNVLAVDVRGHGATGGAIDWQQAVRDVVVWLDWLRTEGGVRPDAMFTMGSSMGSSLAILGCAEDALCAGAVAVSPGWNYYNLRLEEAIALRPVLVLYAERDRWPALGVPRMVDAAPDTLTVASLAGNAHGMDFLLGEAETLYPVLLDWLAAHQP